MPTKRKSLCPGCKTQLNKTMSLLPPSKHCAGPPAENKILDDELSEGGESSPCRDKSVSSPLATSGPQKQLELHQLLVAMRNLLLQLEGITKEQTTMKKRMHETSARNAPKIQLANRKFRWLFVYLFDVQMRVHAASRKDAQVSLDVLDIIMYTTILDVPTLRLYPKQCTFASPLII